MPIAGPETYLEVLEGLLGRWGWLWLMVGARTLTAEAPGKYCYYCYVLFCSVVIVFIFYLFFLFLKTFFNIFFIFLLLLYFLLFCVFCLIIDFSQL